MRLQSVGHDWATKQQELWHCIILVYTIAYHTVPYCIMPSVPHHITDRFTMKSRSVTVRTTPWLPAISCPRRPVCGKPGNEQKVTLWARNSSRFMTAPCIHPAISRGRLKMHWWGPPCHWTALSSTFISHWVFVILYPAWDHPAPCFLLDLLFPTCKKFPSNPGLLGAPPTLLASSLLGSSASALSCLQNALPGTQIAVSQFKSLFRYKLLRITDL